MRGAGSSHQVGTPTAGRGFGCRASLLFEFSFNFFRAETYVSKFWASFLPGLGFSGLGP